MRKYIIFGIFSIFLIACSKSNVDNPVKVKEVTPRKDYAMLIFESQSCIYCKQLDKDMRENQTLKESINQIDVFKLDVDGNAKVQYRLLGEEGITTEKNLARTLRVSSFPYILMYDAKGNIILSLPGYVPPKTLSCIIQYVNTKYYEKSNLKDYLKAREC